MDPRKPVGISRNNGKAKQAVRVSSRQQTPRQSSKHSANHEDLFNLEDYIPDDHNPTLPHSTVSKSERSNKNRPPPSLNPQMPIKLPNFPAFKLGEPIGRPHVMWMDADTHLRYYNKYGNGTLSGAELAMFVDRSYCRRLASDIIPVPQQREANPTNTLLRQPGLQGSTPQVSTLPR
ncbi:hypothetical protein HD806DRAFT_535846 [Xylariaceae sp. AK1471]|nr:hypothetical protein HD806DRAFT_535846 [Xylariaceae sp. AK1471]